jgi:hypothetical protein
LSEEGTSPILTISPNPTSGKFEIVLNSADKFTIEIVDPTGRKVYEQITSEEKTSIDLSKEGAGVYYVVVKNDSMFINRKIVIE